jgi:hypothetical protein
MNHWIYGIWQFFSRHLLLILFCLFVASSSAMAQRKSDRESQGYFGPLASIKTYVAELEINGSNILENKRRIDETRTYDLNGHELEWTTYDDEGEILSAHKKVYEKGQLLQETIAHSEYLYLFDKVTYEYDAKGNRIVENGYTADGELQCKIIYKYDSNDNVREESHQPQKNPNNPNLYCNRYEKQYRYDERKRVIEEATYKQVDGLLQPEDFRVGYYKRVLLQGQSPYVRIELRFSSDERLYDISAIQYDNKGNEISDAAYKSNGQLITKLRYQYKYDAHGNAIKMTREKWVNEDGKFLFRPTEVEYYSISYFTNPKSKPTK